MARTAGEDLTEHSYVAWERISGATPGITRGTQVLQYHLGNPLEVQVFLR